MAMQRSGFRRGEPARNPVRCTVRPPRRISNAPAAGEAHLHPRKEPLMKLIIIALFIVLTAFTALADHKPYTRNVAIVVYKDAEPLDWTGPYEVWHDAASFGSFHDEPA